MNLYRHKHILESDECGHERLMERLVYRVESQKDILELFQWEQEEIKKKTEGFNSIGFCYNPLEDDFERDANGIPVRYYHYERKETQPILYCGIFKKVPDDCMEWEPNEMVTVVSKDYTELLDRLNKLAKGKITTTWEVLEEECLKALVQWDITKSGDLVIAESARELYLDIVESAMGEMV